MTSHCQLPIAECQIQSVIGIRQLAIRMTQSLTLTAPVESLESIGPIRAKHLRAIGLLKLGDLLEYFPRTYIFESAEGSIASVRPDQIHTVRGEVVAVDYVPGRSRGRFEATLSDGTDKLGLVWFNQSWLRSKIHPGLNIRVRGRVKFFRNIPQMANAKWELLEGDEAQLTEEKLRPIYPATINMPSERIGTIIDQHLDEAVKFVDEWFDAGLLGKRRLIAPADAYRLVHRPMSLNDAKKARRRLVYDELMLMQLGLGLSKHAARRPNHRAGACALINCSTVESASDFPSS